MAVETSDKYRRFGGERRVRITLIVAAVALYFIGLPSLVVWLGEVL
jgi:hypothetical protein